MGRVNLLGLFFRHRLNVRQVGGPCYQSLPPGTASPHLENRRRGHETWHPSAFLTALKSYAWGFITPALTAGK